MHGAPFQHASAALALIRDHGRTGSKTTRMPQVIMMIDMALAPGHERPFDRPPRPPKETNLCRTGSVVTVRGRSLGRRGGRPRFADVGPGRVEQTRSHQTPTNDQRPREGAFGAKPLS